MTRARPTTEAVHAVARVAAYASAVWRFDPNGTVVLTSAGSPKFAAGTRVRLARVHGHRDVGLTACPGTLYDQLGEVRRKADALLGPVPRILSLELSGAPVRAPGPLVLSAGLNRSASWMVELRDPAGQVAGFAAGDGPQARLEWHGLRPLGDPRGLPLLPALPGTYTWTIEVGDGIRAPDRRQGRVEVGLPVVSG